MQAIGQQFKGVVERGTRYASGLAPDTPFGDGTITLQKPFFLTAFEKIDPSFAAEVREYYDGTVNVRIEEEVELDKPDITLRDVPWHSDYTEHFSFAFLILKCFGKEQRGLLYYPHPETKPPTNAHNYNRLEVWTRYIPGIEYHRSALVGFDRPNVLKIRR